VPGRHIGAGQRDVDLTVALVQHEAIAALELARASRKVRGGGCKW
jgi:hypothetical protein